MNTVATIHGECMLLDWSETAKGGSKIVLQLASPDDLEPFKAMTLAKGKVAGQRFMYALAEVGDDEKPAQQPEFDDIARSIAAKRKEAALARDASGFKEECEKARDSYELKGGDLCRMAAIWSKDPDFLEWLKLAWPERYRVGISGEDVGAEMIRIICGIQSRRELDHNATAAAVFHRDIRLPYMKHLEAKR